MCSYHVSYYAALLTSFTTYFSRFSTVFSFKEPWENESNSGLRAVNELTAGHGLQLPRNGFNGKVEKEMLLP